MNCILNKITHTFTKIEIIKYYKYFSMRNSDLVIKF